MPSPNRHNARASPTPPPGYGGVPAAAVQPAAAAPRPVGRKVAEAGRLRPPGRVPAAARRVPPRARRPPPRPLHL